MQATLEEIDISECSIFDEILDGDACGKIRSEDKIASGLGSGMQKAPNFCAVNSKFRRIATSKRDISTKSVFQGFGNMLFKKETKLLTPLAEMVMIP